MVFDVWKREAIGGDKSWNDPCPHTINQFGNKSLKAFRMVGSVIRRWHSFKCLTHHVQHLKEFNECCDGRTVWLKHLQQISGGGVLWDVCCELLPENTEQSFKKRSTTTMTFPYCKQTAAGKTKCNTGYGRMMNSEETTRIE